jgi:nitrogen fixation protein FixH
MNILSWRWFPFWMIASMGAVFAVNGYMIYDALHTFPGSAGEDGFDLSNGYKYVLATAQQQAALGWQIEAEATAAGLPELRLSDRNGAPLAAAAIDAQAERPIGPAQPTVLRFQSMADGRYRANQTLSAGQWDIMLTVRADDRRYSATRRVVVK